LNYESPLDINKKPKSKAISFILDVLINLAIVVAIAVFIRLFIIEPFNVKGSSMCDTLNFVNGECKQESERILVNKLSYLEVLGFKIGEPQRGDIVVFQPPQGKSDSYIKRIIGLPGETLELRNGEVYIFNQANPEGFMMEENYLNEKNNGKTFPLAGKKKFTIDEDSYFVMGDNRANSTDSRVCFRLDASCHPGDKEFITVKDINGKAWTTIWPLHKIRFIH